MRSLAVSASGQTLYVGGGLNAGSYAGMTQGAWSVVASDDYVMLGGEFTRVNGVPQQGLVRLARPGRAPERQGPVDRSAATAPTVAPAAAAPPQSPGCPTGTGTS